MSYLAQGINNGAQLGGQAYLQMLRLADEEKARKQRAEETLAERKLRVQMAADNMANDRQMLEKRLLSEADNLKFNRNWQSEEAQKNRTFESGQRMADSFAKRGAEARARFDAYNPNLPENQVRQATIDRLQAEAAALSQKQSAEPFAEVIQSSPDGLTKTRARVPMSQVSGFGQSQAAPTVSSPYDAEITKTRQAIADDQMQMAEGDNRTGFFNYRSRQSQVADNRMKLMRLQALAIQERYERGEITKEQADEMSRNLMPQ